MINRIISLFVVAAALVTTGVKAQSMEDLGKIRFTGVQSIRIVQEGAMRVALVKVEISNQSGSDILLADGAYNVTFEKGGKAFIKLPFAKPAGETRIPKGSMMSAGKAVIGFAVALGDTSSATTDETLIPLFNLISAANDEALNDKAAKPENKLTIVLDGKVRFGVQVNNATVFRSEEIRWTLTPKPVDHMVFTN